METTPDELWSPDSVDLYNLVINLGAMQDTVQAALESIRNLSGFHAGTTSERTAFTTAGYPVEGDVWSDTTLSDVLVYRSGSWVPVNQPVFSRFARTASSDAAVGSGTTTGLVTGTISNAKPGQYLLVARASLYASAGVPVVGYIYAQWQSGGGTIYREEARWDLPNVGSYPTSPTVQIVITHPGGNLAVTTGYRRSSGTFAVTGQSSGETVITATYLGSA